MKSPRFLLGCALALAAAGLYVVWNNPSGPVPGPAPVVALSDAPVRLPVSRTPVSRSRAVLPAFPNPPKLVLDMNVAERNQLADEWRSQPTPVLAENLFQTIRSNGDPGLIDLASRLLVPKLQSDVSDAEKVSIYGTIDALLISPDVTTSHKSELIQLLGNTATPESLDLLIGLALKNSLPAFQPLLEKTISEIGDARWAGRFHEELSPPLEQAWANSAEVPRLRAALANGIAGVGSPQGVEFLMAKALSTAATVSQFEAQEDNLAWHVSDAFRNIRNPAAVPVLASHLRDQPSDDLALFLSGSSLASMGRADATAALLNWAATSQRPVADLLEPWLAQVRDPDSLSLLEQAGSDSSRFAHQENWQAAARALRQWHAQRQTATSEN